MGKTKAKKSAPVAIPLQEDIAAINAAYAKDYRLASPAKRACAVRIGVVTAKENSELQDAELSTLAIERASQFGVLGEFVSAISCCD